MSELPDAPQSNVEKYLSVMAGVDAQLPDHPQSRVEAYLAYLAEHGTGGAVTKADIGLGNVDNTSDADKPISTAAQAALDNKVDKVEGKGLSTEDYTTAEKEAVASIRNKVDKADGKGLSTNDYTDVEKEAVAAIGNKVDKIEGKSLSTEDYTTAEKTKLAGIPEDATNYQGTITGITMNGESKGTSGIVDLGTVLTEHQDISGKVDKVNGKGLSTNDYTTAEKTKLAGMEAGAQVNEVSAEQYQGVVDKLDSLSEENALLRELLSGIDAPVYRSTGPDNPVTFSDGYANAPVKNLSVEIAAVQSGSGDPSPDNIRPISGWNSVTITRAGENGADTQSVTISMGDAGTVCGGTLDVTTGLLTVTWYGIADMSEFVTAENPDNRAIVNTSTDLLSFGFGRVRGLPTGVVGRTIAEILSSHFINTGEHTSKQWGTMDLDSGVWLNLNGFVTGTGAATVADAANWFKAQSDAGTPVRFAWKLAAPVTYQLSPAEITTLSGYNAVSADAGPVSVTYRADPSLSLEGDSV